MELYVYAAISTSPPTYSETPFFATLIKHVLWPFPAIPLDLMRTPFKSTILQPPLTMSPEWQQDGLIGTSDWKRFEFSEFKGHVKPVRYEGLISDDDSETRKRVKKFANGREFPDIDPHRLGLEWTDCTIIAPAPESL